MPSTLPRGSHVVFPFTITIIIHPASKSLGAKPIPSARDAHSALPFSAASEEVVWNGSPAED